jgi:hypothetical protein
MKTKKQWKLNKKELQKWAKKQGKKNKEIKINFFTSLMGE